MTITNRKFTLASRPKGMPTEDNFKLVTEELREPAEGEFVVKNLYLSVDPYMRGRMNDVRSYADPVNIGDVMVGGTVGRVVASRNPAFAEGDHVMGYFGWTEYVVTDGGGASMATKVDPKLAPISTSLGVLGMPGMTAYFGLLDVCDPKEGETVFVSGAAGAVGSCVGQIAKIRGCRVVGSAGSQAKVDYLVDELGFDAAFNYKEVDDYAGKLAELCPKRIDCYFDNVGGAMSDAVFMNLNFFSRVSICGQISMYNSERPEMGPRLVLGTLLVNQATARGFIVTNFMNKFPEGVRQLGQWIAEGKIKYRETIVEGFENMPSAFLGLFKGENIGKQLVKVADE